MFHMCVNPQTEAAHFLENKKKKNFFNKVNFKIEFSVTDAATFTDTVIIRILKNDEILATISMCSSNSMLRCWDEVCN